MMNALFLPIAAIGIFLSIIGIYLIKSDDYATLQRYWKKGLILRPY